MRADDRRSQILACARDVFARHGFHVASIADICQAAGIARGTLYQYFANKREVFFAVADDLAARVEAVLGARPKLEEVRGADQASPEIVAGFCTRRLRDLLEAVFADEATLRLLARESRGLDGGLERAIRRIDAIVSEALERDLEITHRLGVLDCPDPGMTALFILGGVEKMCLTALESDAPIDLEAIVRVAVNIQLFGLLSASTRARQPERRLPQSRSDHASDKENP
jgi:AcrR family transcriptional regulator